MCCLSSRSIHIHRKSNADVEKNRWNSSKVCSCVCINVCGCEMQGKLIYPYQQSHITQSAKLDFHLYYYCCCVFFYLSGTVPVARVCVCNGLHVFCIAFHRTGTQHSVWMTWYMTFALVLTIMAFMTTTTTTATSNVKGATSRMKKKHVI